MKFILRFYFSPFFSLELYHHYSVTKSQLGDYFMVLALTGGVAATPGILILRKCLKLSSIMALGAFLAVIGNSLMGFCPLFLESLTSSSSFG